MTKAILVSLIAFILALPVPAPAAPGDLDPAFGNGGVVTTDFEGLAGAVVLATAVQSDGKIVTAGYVAGGGTTDVLLLRYNADGTADATFGSNGVVVTDIGLMDNRAQSLAIQPDGKIVVGGHIYTSANTDFLTMRYNSDGTLDSTFNGTGYAIHSFSSSRDEVNAVALQADGKIVVAGGASVGGWDFALARYNNNGTLDTTFDSDGVLTTQVQGSTDIIQSVLIQPDGKIVAGGDSYSGSYAFVAARYNSNGTLDTTFDSDGIAIVNLSGGNDMCYGLARQADGKLVLAGTVTNNNIALVRLNTNGSLDATFSADGIVIADLGFPWEDLTDVAIQTDQKIVAFGVVNDNDLAVVRYDSAGSLDATFSGDGLATFDLSGNRERANAGAIQADGKIIAVGASYDYVKTDALLVRFSSTGSFDSTFAGTGHTTASLTASTSDQAIAVAFQADGKILVAGNSYDESDNFSVARYNPDGSLDASFGSGGKALFDYNHTYDYMTSIVVQEDGKILIGGYVENSSPDFAALRLNPDGSPDSSFGSNGWMIADPTGDYEEAQGMILQPDGRIVLAGAALIGGDYHFALYRVLPDGSSDTSFDGDGLVVTDFGNEYEEIYAVALQPDGKIVAAGYTHSGSANYVALARYNPDGSLDPSFDGDGIATTELAGIGGRGNVVLVQPNGRIVVGFGAGNVNLLRFRSDGSLDSSFGNGGLVTSDFGYQETCYSLAWQSGKLVAAGSAYMNGENQILVARYESNGAVDATFASGGSSIFSPMGYDGYAMAAGIAPDGDIVAAGSTEIGEDYDFVLVRLQGGMTYYEDFRSDAAGWVKSKGSWSVSAGNLEGTHDGKADILSPGAPCSTCILEADMAVETPGGRVSLLGWHQDKRNMVELILMEDRDRWLLKHRSNGTVVAKAKVSAPLVPGQFYHVRITFDGSAFEVWIDDEILMTATTAAPANGTAGFRVKSTNKLPATGLFSGLSMHP